MEKTGSFIWKIPEDELKKAISESTSFAEFFRKFQIEGKAGAYSTLKRRLGKLEIDYSHIKMGKYSNRGRIFLSPENKIPLKDILIEGSSYSRYHLKRRLIKEGYLKNECAICGLGPEWNNKELIMNIDHINGVNDDNRIGNLRLICPNCHSQTPTFAGRGLRKNKCEVCLTSIKAKHKYCVDCLKEEKRKDRPSTRKVKDRPSKTVLTVQVKKMGYEGTGRLYGVSGNAVRKWLK